MAEAATRFPDVVIAEYTEGPWSAQIVIEDDQSGEDALFGRKGRYLIYNRDFSDQPVPQGYWMDFWDKDLKEICGVRSEKGYLKLTVGERARRNCMVQVRKYIPEQYFYNYARHHYPEQYEDWWQAHGMSMGGWVNENAYWKKRIIEEKQNEHGCTQIH